MPAAPPGHVTFTQQGPIRSVAVVPGTGEVLTASSCDIYRHRVDRVGRVLPEASASCGLLRTPQPLGGMALLDGDRLAVASGADLLLYSDAAWIDAPSDAAPDSADALPRPLAPQQTWAPEAMGLVQAPGEAALPRPTGPVRLMAAAPHAPLLATGWASGLLAVVDAVAGAAVAQWHRAAPRPTSVAWAGHDALLVADAAGRLTRLHAHAPHAAGERLLSGRDADGWGVPHAAARIACLAVNPHNPAQLATGHEDGCVRVWDQRAIRRSSGGDLGGGGGGSGGAQPLISVYDVHQGGPVWALAYVPDRPGTVASCGQDGAVQMTAVSPGAGRGAAWVSLTSDERYGGGMAAVGARPSNVLPLYSLACHPDEPWLVAAGEAGALLSVSTEPPAPASTSRHAA